MTRTCKTCERQFAFQTSQLRHYKGAGQYCSRKCSYQGTVDATAHKPIPDRYGRSRRKADREWQKAVREKDNYTCQRCGKYDLHIHTHHVATRARRPDLRLEVSNGKCLCNSCHSWVHEHPIEAKDLGLLDRESYELARTKAHGSAVGGAKFTDEEVVALRLRCKNGEGPKALALECGVERSTMQKLLRGTTYPGLAHEQPGLQREHWITFDGKTQRHAEWAREIGISPGGLLNRLHRWDSIEKALTTPVEKHKTPIRG